MKTTDMEIAIAHYWGIRQNLIIPNISWGLDIHECDLLIMSKAGYLTEIEIKISAADLKKDLQKRHKHEDYRNRVKYLFFAIPIKLISLIEFIPEKAGIIVVDEFMRVRTIVDPICNKNVRPLTDKEMFQLARLGAMRIWGLKGKIRDYKKLLTGLKRQEPESQ